MDVYHLSTGFPNRITRHHPMLPRAPCEAESSVFRGSFQSAPLRPWQGQRQGFLATSDLPEGAGDTSKKRHTLWQTYKKLHNYMENIGQSPFYSWVNQLFLWTFPKLGATVNSDGMNMVSPSSIPINPFPHIETRLEY